MKNRKIAAILLAVCLLLSGCASAPAETEPERLAVTAEPQTAPVTEPATEPTTAPTTEPEPQDEHFILTFAGDCTLGSNPVNYYASASFINLVGEDYGYPFRNVLEYFENDDFTMVNLEGTLCDGGAPANKTFTFRGPSAYINILTENSVEAVNLANNHTLDYGAAGYASTKALLEEGEIAYVERNATAIFTTESGLTIGLCAANFTFDVDTVRAQVEQLREQGAEIVVFAVHWGQEGSYRPMKYHETLAHELIDAGVDILFGTHPHVLQKVEQYNGGVILYSMGNFCFGGNHQPKDLDTALVQQEVIRDPEGNISLGELTLIPASISSIPVQNNFQPTPYEEGSEEYDRAMSKLDGTWTGYDLVVSY